MKERLIQIAMVLLALGLGAWLVSATEWADTETPTPSRGEARSNPLYGVQRLLRELGGTVVKRPSLDAMPPPDARLVLLTPHWDVLADRVRLREWVEGGGHLIVPGRLARHDALKAWLPIRNVDRTLQEQPGTRADTEGQADADADAAPAPAPKPKAPTPPKPTKQPPAARSSKPIANAKPDRDRDCRAMTEPASVPASYGNSRSYRFCGFRLPAWYVPTGAQRPTWALETERGAEAMRVAMGKGSVTVVGNWAGFSNTQLMRGDNALVAAAALQAAPGAQWWFIADEAREPFLPWLWHRGWIAIVLGLVALAAALWRAAVRFGPLVAVPGQQRRSMAEQVRGTAQFLQQHGGAALHGAQVRALHDCAGRQLRRRSQRTPAERDAAIAAATGIDIAVLQRALDKHTRNPNALAADLELLETARRRLEAMTLQPASSAPSSS